MDPSGEQTDTVTFQRFNDHWDSYGGTDGVEFVELVYYPSQEGEKLSRSQMLLADNSNSLRSIFMQLASLVAATGVQ